MGVVARSEVLAVCGCGSDAHVYVWQVNGDLKRTSDFIDGLRIPYIAPSLGGCESLVEQPTIISYW